MRIRCSRDPIRRSSVPVPCCGLGGLPLLASARLGWGLLGVAGLNDVTAQQPWATARGRQHGGSVRNRLLGRRPDEADATWRYFDSIAHAHSVGLQADFSLRPAAAAIAKAGASSAAISSAKKTSPFESDPAFGASTATMPKTAPLDQMGARMNVR